MTAANHVGNTTRSARDNVLTIVELANILSNVGATDASMALNVHVISQSHHNALNLGRKFAGRGKDEGLGLAHGGIDDLEHRDRKSGCFTGTGLGLGDGIATLADLNNGAGLDSRGGLISVGVDTAKETLCFQNRLVSVQSAEPQQPQNICDATRPTLQGHRLESRMNRYLLGGRELNLFIGLAIDSAFSHVGNSVDGLDMFLRCVRTGDAMSWVRMLTMQFDRSVDLVEIISAPETKTAHCTESATVIDDGYAMSTCGGTGVELSVPVVKKSCQDDKPSGRQNVGQPYLMERRGICDRAVGGFR